MTRPLGNPVGAITWTLVRLLPLFHHGSCPEEQNLIQSPGVIDSESVIIWTDCHELYATRVVTGETSPIHVLPLPHNDPGPLPSHIHQIATYTYNGVLYVAGIVDLPSKDDDKVETLVAFWVGETQRLAPFTFGWTFYGGVRAHGGDALPVNKCPTMHLKWEKQPQYEPDFPMRLLVSSFTMPHHFGRKGMDSSNMQLH